MYINYLLLKMQLHGMHIRVLGFMTIATCNMTSLYERFFSRIEYKLAHTYIRSFYLSFTMEFIIVNVMKGTLVSQFKQDWDRLRYKPC